MEHKPKLPYPITIRVQALTMMTIGVDIKVVEASLGLSRQTIQYWVKKARERGYNPAVDFRILPEYVEDGKRSGRPKKISGESTEEAILEPDREDSNGQEKSSKVPTFEAGISYSSVLHNIPKHGSERQIKTKPGVANEMKQERLIFALPIKIKPFKSGRM